MHQKKSKQDEPAALNPANDQWTIESSGYDLVPLLISISRSTRNILQIKLAEVGFQNGQDETLLAMDEAGTSTLSELANKVCVRPSTMSKMVETLAIRGMVSRMADPLDSRRVYVRLTQEGMSARQTLRTVRKEIERDLSRLLGPDEIGRMRTELLAVDRQLRKRLSRLR